MACPIDEISVEVVSIEDIDVDVTILKALGIEDDRIASGQGDHEGHPLEDLCSDGTQDCGEADEAAGDSSYYGGNDDSEPMGWGTGKARRSKKKSVKRREKRRAKRESQTPNQYGMRASFSCRYPRPLANSVKLNVVNLPAAQGVYIGLHQPQENQRSNLQVAFMRTASGP
ncbi:hypothetical protein HYDPIDRAFT_32118 [Hydnomerulius pinastri MD-312]|uniref:Uncharacterized protein n=1 Tax=Hydnomerulius pinastri MD-312 TaxID=994086 RepID=A0A0C9WAV0_9AGAM|nr:hypothetical protein HYDPIDRAFT_32118 [Hydnomerulius pinastri MD-312]